MKKVMKKDKTTGLLGFLIIRWKRLHQRMMYENLSVDTIQRMVAGASIDMQTKL